MVASSLTRHPITIGDKTYDMSPLDDAAHDSLDEWVRSKYVERNVGYLEKLQDKDKALAFKVAYDQAASLSWMSPFGARLMGTVEGVARLLYEGIRKNHPDITFEQLKKEMLDPDNIAKANAAFRHLNMPDKKGVKTKRASRKRKST